MIRAQVYSKGFLFFIRVLGSKLKHDTSGHNSLVGKIDKNGYLFIERGGRMERQDCPYTRMSPCSHSCPKFGNPDMCSGRTVFLAICGGQVLVFKKFVDEREEFK